MSTNFAVRPPVSYGSLLEAGCVREDDKLGWATDENHPVKMPNDHFVWVYVKGHKVVEFVRFGGNNPDWMIEFCEGHDCKVVSEHDSGY